MFGACYSMKKDMYTAAALKMSKHGGDVGKFGNWMWMKMFPNCINGHIHNFHQVRIIEILKSNEENSLRLQFQSPTKAPLPWDGSTSSLKASFMVFLTQTLTLSDMSGFVIQSFMEELWDLKGFKSTVGRPFASPPFY